MNDASWFLEGHLFGDMDTWHEAVADIRRRQPVLPASAEGYQPFWVLTRHEDVLAVSRDNERWINTSRAVISPDAEWHALIASGMPEPQTLIHLDGKKHRDHRQVTSDWFKPAAVKHRQDRITEIADMFIARMRELGGSCDFARDVAQPYTLHVIMDIYGVPEEDEALMMELTQGLFGANDPEFMGDAEDPNAKFMESVMRFISYFNDLTADRRACPGDDLASVIANGQVDGCPMGDAERLWYYIIVATAGHDTTSYSLSGGMEALLGDPKQVAALRADPTLATNAADEAIRWSASVRHFMRHATEPTTIRDVTIPEGGRVLLSYPAANRDEDAFIDPMHFDIARPDADKLLSFGGGSHYCLGSQFARREIRTMFERLMPQLASIEPAGSAEWSQTNFVSGVKHLPVAYRFA